MPFQTSLEQKLDELERHIRNIWEKGNSSDQLEIPKSSVGLGRVLVNRFISLFRSSSR